MDLVFAPRQIETWPIDKLCPYAKNAKIHGETQVAKIAASMAKFGWTVPCLVADDGELNHDLFNGSPPNVAERIHLEMSPIEDILCLSSFGDICILSPIDDIWIKPCRSELQ